MPHMFGKNVIAWHFQTQLYNDKHLDFQVRIEPDLP